MNDLKFIARLWADWSPGYDATDDLGPVQVALGEAANLEATLGYYRAMFDPTRQSADLVSEQLAMTTAPPQPTLCLHGADDGYMGADLAGETAGLLSCHFPHLEQPAQVRPLPA
jgi:pimeloyl-ACP methyl ester carboxylesterase